MKNQIHTLGTPEKEAAKHEAMLRRFWGALVSLERIKEDADYKFCTFGIQPSQGE